jgi:hypothetical protein
MTKMTKAAALAAMAGGLIAAGAGVANASATPEGVAAGSPGVGAGNLVQGAVHVPVNFCGNTLNSSGALNPAFGNTCSNAG